MLRLFPEGARGEAVQPACARDCPEGAGGVAVQLTCARAFPEGARGEAVQPTCEHTLGLELCTTILVWLNSRPVNIHGDWGYGLPL